MDHGEKPGGPGWGPGKGGQDVQGVGLDIPGNKCIRIFTKYIFVCTTLTFIIIHNCYFPKRGWPDMLGTIEGGQ